MATKRSDEFKKIRKKYDDAKDNGTLTSGDKRKDVYSKQDVTEANKEVKRLWSKVINILDEERMMGHDDLSNSILSLGLSIADVKTMAMDMAKTFEDQDKIETIVKDESRENTVRRRVRRVAGAKGDKGPVLTTIDRLRKENSALHKHAKDKDKELKILAKEIETLKDVFGGIRRTTNIKNLRKVAKNGLSE